MCGGVSLEFWTPGPSFFFEEDSLHGPVPGPLPSRTLRVTPHTIQNWVLVSFPVDPRVRNRRNSAPTPTLTPPPVPAPPSGPKRAFPRGFQPLRPQDPVHRPASWLSFLPASQGSAGRDPLWAALPSGPPLATGRQWRRLLPKRRRGRVSHAAGAREPAPPPPSRAAA